MKYTAIICAIAMSISVSAQGLELGITAGGTQYHGDLTHQTLNTHTMGPALGLYVRHNFHPFISWRANFQYASFRGDDAYATDPTFQTRNLSFRTTIYEASLVGELHLLPNTSENAVIPYVFAGFSGFYFNPQSAVNGTWVDLQPLGTEGQGTSAYPERQPYSQTTFAIPFGGGVKWFLGNGMVIGMELGFRKTFTDYLDDVSTTYVDLNMLATENGSLAAQLSYRQNTGDPNEPAAQVDGRVRGNPMVKDYFVISAFTFSIPLYSRYSGMGRTKDRTRYGCPSTF